MSFDLIAPVYDVLSRLVFGRSLQRAQTLFLSGIGPNSHVLMLGGGTGILLNEVLTICRPASVLYIEASARMLTLARRRVQFHALAKRVEFRYGTQDSLLPGETFTVVMLPFVLDVSPEPILEKQVLPPLMRATKPGGLWLVTDFVNSPRRSHRVILQTMYLFFRGVSGIRATQLPAINRLLTEAGLRQTNCQPAAGGQVEASCWTRI